MVEKILDHKLITLDPFLYLLTIVDSDLPTRLKYALTHIIMTARLLNTQYWKMTLIPSEEMLTYRVRVCIEMAR